MKINRLIDDFEDETIRQYWEKNFQYLATHEVKEKIGSNYICFSPAYRLNILSSSDFYISKDNHSLTKSIAFSEQSSQDIYDCFNYLICTYITESVVSWGGDNEFWRSRSSLFDPAQVREINQLFSQHYSGYPFSPPLSFFKLRIFCKDLLFLGILVENFNLKISTEDLLSLCEKQKEEILIKISSF